MTRGSVVALDPETRSRLLDGAMADAEFADWQARFAEEPALAAAMASALAEEARLRDVLAGDHAGQADDLGMPRRGWWRRSAVWVALAAGFAGLAIGFGGGAWLAVGSDSSAVAWTAGLQHALENQPSGGAVALADLPGPLGAVTLEIERTYRAADGRFCRAYRQSVASPAGVMASTGIACREADGTWRLFDTGAGGDA
ncbi:MAG: DVU3141 family protein [Azospirillaceae bacterium]